MGGRWGRGAALVTEMATVQGGGRVCSQEQIGKGGGSRSGNSGQSGSGSGSGSGTGRVGGAAYSVGGRVGGEKGSWRK